MLVYTFATIAFYLLGAAVLGRLGLIPADKDMIRTLAVMYEPVFGRFTATIFLMGAFAVLYSTFLVANAGHARVCADAWRVFIDPAMTTAESRIYISVFNGLFPVLCLLMYLYFKSPQRLVFASGAAQAIMLPMLAFTAIYFRYTRIDSRLAPGKFWDRCLWISAAIMVVASVSLVYVKARG